MLLFATSALPAGQPLLMRLLGAAARAAIERGYRRRFGELCPDASTQAESWTLPLMAERLREVEGFPAEKQILLDGIRSRLPASGLVAEN